MTAEEATKLLGTHDVVLTAQEVKVAVLTFQQVPKVICPTFVLCGQQQKVNKVTNFDNIIISGCLNFCGETHEGSKTG